MRIIDNALISISSSIFHTKRSIVRSHQNCQTAFGRCGLNSFNFNMLSKGHGFQGVNNESIVPFQVNGFTCSCVSGWTGDLCETEVNECESNPCVNGATCQEGFNQYRCACPAGYTGNTSPPFFNPLLTYLSNLLPALDINKDLARTYPACLLDSQ